MEWFQTWSADFCDTFTRCFIKDNRYMLLLDGIGVTIRVSLVAVLIGIAIGLLIALCNLSSNKLLKLIGGIYTDVIRGTPSVTQLMIIYFVIFASVNLSKWIIAAIAFGPKSVIIIAGYNKIVRNLEEAEIRVKRTAAPANCERLSCGTYCSVKGECVSLSKSDREICDGCESDDRICCNYLISAHQRHKGRIKVIIVGEELGY